MGLVASSALSVGAVLQLETRLSCCAVAVVWLCGTAYRRTEGRTAGLSGNAGSSRQKGHRGSTHLL